MRARHLICLLALAGALSACTSSPTAPTAAAPGAAQFDDAAAPGGAHGSGTGG